MKFSIPSIIIIESIVAKIKFIVLTLILVFFGSAILKSQVDYVGEKKLELTINGKTFKIPYYSDLLIDTPNSEIENAVIVIHGVNRDADAYFANLNTAASMRPSLTQSTIIIAPQFLIELDINKFGLDAEHLYWSDGGWVPGSNSLNNSGNPRSERIPSFAVLDTLMYRLAKNFPNLKTIVFTGHSAGGQLVNRYSATTPIVDALCYQFHVSTKFVVANPSSYMYLDKKRKKAGSIDEFEIPVTTCADYNDWKYGLDNLYSYPALFGSEAIRNRLSTRQVVYILGGDDDNPNSSSLDVSCEAMLQGNHRLERGSVYYNYLKNYYGNSILDFHSLDTVPNVGHNNLGMYTSEIGLYHLFESYPMECSLSSTKPSMGNNLKFCVYPNPTYNYLYISSNAIGASLNLYSLTGVRLRTEENITIPELLMDISNLANGFYILEYQSDDIVKSERIIKIDDH
ncbi:MAG: T9SS type A sorting domain-containing protein [Bacteroidales bacterium]|nr:T9SS type A sorting domain-containing protein [Bacteroidales bacterium]